MTLTPLSSTSKHFSINILFSLHCRLVEKSILRTTRGCDFIRIPGAPAALSQCHPLDSRIRSRTSLSDLLGSSQQPVNGFASRDLSPSTANLSDFKQSPHLVTRWIGPHEWSHGARRWLQSTHTPTSAPQRAHKLAVTLCAKQSARLSTER